MKAKCVLFVIVYPLMVLGILQISYGQLDTLGFPLDIGNKWFYRYEASGMTTHVRVKTIIDTLVGGARAVRTTRLGTDTTTVGTETWSVINGNFLVNSLILYVASLTLDSTWYIVFPHDDGSYHLAQVTLFGLNTKCQIRSQHFATVNFSESWYEQRVAVGVGFYSDNASGYGGEFGWFNRSQLIGILKRGTLYGDSSLLTTVGLNSDFPATFGLPQNYPNPFNPITTIKFQVPHSSFVTLKIFDMLGREIATLVNEEMRAGMYENTFDGNGLASGVYLYRLQAGGFRQTRKLLLLR